MFIFYYYYILVFFMFYDSYFILFLYFIILILYYFYILLCLSFIILIFYQPCLLFFSSFIIFIFHYPYPLSFIILKFMLIFIFMFLILIVLIILLTRSPLLITNIKQNTPRRESNFSPGVFWKDRAPNNATPTRQTFEAGIIRRKICLMYRKFSVKLCKMETQKLPGFPTKLIQHQLTSFSRGPTHSKIP